MAILINNSEAEFPTVAPLISPAHQALPYQIYGLGFEYKHSEGVVGMPVASAPRTRDNPVPCEIVRRHAPAGSLTIRFQIEREADWPIIPSPEPQSPNLVYAWSEYRVATPNLNNIGCAHFFAIAGTFFYIMRQPIWAPLSGLYAGWNPISVTPFFFVSASQFRPLV